MPDQSKAALTVVFSPQHIPDRRSAWIRRELLAELTLAVARVAAAHPDVKMWIDGSPVIADQLASVTDLLDARALKGGAVDGRATIEIAAAVGLPRAAVDLQLSHPQSGLSVGDDGRWYPKLKPPTVKGRP